ncbi:legumain [Procambarus clarkii]|uniref:legumain n=1 Tax=Procambarus clarkii TaxID=6728 RepID=UPI001E678911|nr:legumain-like [Procambarus clarkii]XP_045622224.1 legumain-like [Procambarus clarkii]
MGRVTAALVVLVGVIVSFSQARVAAPEPDGELWAVLVAGSSTWMNYRHQADVCHAYQILHQHGVPDDHIIVMMYDDIANNKMNPIKGKIINRPDGPDVYKGVPKDYTGKDVTPETFLKVLQGDAEGLKEVGSGKVLKSGPNDRVFINMVDHGAPGIFAFPESYLYVKNFTNGILDMQRNKRFKELTVYMEACEAGSMFKNIPDDINVYALSASNSTESSYACYLDKKVGTFLGDVFSIKWMEDTDREDVTKETLEKQFNVVKKATTTSHVMQWGEKSIDTEAVGAFVGSKSVDAVDFGPFFPIDDPCLTTSIASPDVPLAMLQSLVDAADGLTGADFWQHEIDTLQENRTFVKDTMRKIVKVVTGDDDLTEKMMTNTFQEIHNDDCYQSCVETFHSLCFNLGLNPYALRVTYAMVNLCEHGYSAEQFSCASRAVCVHDAVTGIN